MKTCPSCRQSINASAVVDAFNDPANWLFWGPEGARWVVCQSPAYVHFRAVVKGRTQHRMAIIRQHATDWIETERAAAEENNASRNHSYQTDGRIYAKEANEWL